MVRTLLLLGCVLLLYCIFFSPQHTNVLNAKIYFKIHFKFCWNYYEPFCGPSKTRQYYLWPLEDLSLRHLLYMLNLIGNLMLTIYVKKYVKIYVVFWLETGAGIIRIFFCLLLFDYGWKLFVVNMHYMCILNMIETKNKWNEMKKKKMKWNIKSGLE